MSEKKVLKPVALAVGAALAGTFAISGTVNAEGIDNPFQMSSLSIVKALAAATRKVKAAAVKVRAATTRTAKALAARTRTVKVLAVRTRTAKALAAKVLAADPSKFEPGIK